MFPAGIKKKQFSKKFSTVDSIHSEVYSADPLVVGPSSSTHCASSTLKVKAVKLIPLQVRLSQGKLSTSQSTIVSKTSPNTIVSELLSFKRKTLPDVGLPSRNKQFKSDIKEIEAVLERLEGIYDKLSQLDGIDEEYDDFGRYAASLLRGLPVQKAMQLQHGFINQILKCYVDPLS
ncbi:hypothetical protein C0J52_19455 [Blattella germanica]|nr:hypothetical protein C0J52_19455 [Blattella germanica]